MMSLNVQIDLQMINNDFQSYLIQTKELFGDLLFFDQASVKDFIHYGDNNAKIVFIKKTSSDIKEKEIFQNMLKALKLSMSQILIVDLINPLKFKNNKINNFLKQLQSDTIIILGLDIAQNILENKDDLDALRMNSHTIYDKKVIPTYSLKDMVSEPQFKKYVWSDLKVIV